MAMKLATAGPESLFETNKAISEHDVSRVPERCEVQPSGTDHLARKGLQVNGHNPTCHDACLQSDLHCALLSRFFLLWLMHLVLDFIFDFHHCLHGCIAQQSVPIGSFESPFTMGLTSSRHFFLYSRMMPSRSDRWLYPYEGDRQL